MTTINLWGDLPDGSDIRMPFTILKEQGAILEQQTKGLLVGTIGRNSEGEKTALTFHITAPALNNYSFMVARLVHPIDIYPLVLVDATTTRGVRCDDEERFQLELGKILAGDKIKNVVRGLLAQIRAEISE